MVELMCNARIVGSYVKDRGIQKIKTVGLGFLMQNVDSDQRRDFVQRQDEDY